LFSSELDVLNKLFVTPFLNSLPDQTVSHWQNAAFCHSEPFAFCHSERQRRIYKSAQDKLREESDFSMSYVVQPFCFSRIRLTIDGCISPRKAGRNSQSANETCLLQAGSSAFASPASPFGEAEGGQNDIVTQSVCGAELPD